MFSFIFSDVQTLSHARMQRTALLIPFLFFDIQLSSFMIDMSRASDTLSILQCVSHYLLNWKNKFMHMNATVRLSENENVTMHVIRRIPSYLHNSFCVRVDMTASLQIHTESTWFEFIWFNTMFLRTFLCVNWVFSFLSFHGMKNLLIYVNSKECLIKLNNALNCTEHSLWMLLTNQMLTNFR